MKVYIVVEGHDETFIIHDVFFNKDDAEKLRAKLIRGPVTSMYTLFSLYEREVK